MSSNTTPVENQTLTHMDARLGWIRGERSWVKTRFVGAMILIGFIVMVILSAFSSCGMHK